MRLVSRTDALCLAPSLRQVAWERSRAPHKLKKLSLTQENSPEYLHVQTFQHYLWMDSYTGYTYDNLRKRETSQTICEVCGERHEVTFVRLPPVVESYAPNKSFASCDCPGVVRRDSNIHETLIVTTIASAAIGGLVGTTIGLLIRYLLN